MPCTNCPSLLLRIVLIDRSCDPEVTASHITLCLQHDLSKDSVAAPAVLPPGSQPFSRGSQWHEEVLCSPLQNTKSLAALLIWAHWHGAIHLCPVFDVLKWTGRRDGVFHWHFSWWIKHQRRLGEELNLSIRLRADVVIDYGAQSARLGKKYFRSSKHFLQNKLLWTCPEMSAQNEIGL